MEISLTGRTALVTGSTQGIGLAIARRLAEAGATVWVNGRTQDRVDGVLATLREENPYADLHGVAADVATAGGAARVIEAVPDVDILVNNLGIFAAQDVFEVDDAEWDRSVIAGPTHTEGVEDFVHSLVGQKPWKEAEAEFMREHRPNSIIQRLIEPVEIANLVAYLSSDLASATTGGAIRVDGGIADHILP